jgi:DNA-directed RNA polymerase subunit RPC12/RpoP
MDIVFNCPNCDQELVVDSAAAGSEISCPSCNEQIIIPIPEMRGDPAAPQIPQLTRPPSQPIPQTDPAGGHAINPINVSAAAKEQKRLVVPQRDLPSEVLIKKAAKPLEVAAKESDKMIRIKIIRHTDCIEVGHDRFDEVVSDFLQKVGERDIISITPLTYTHLDIGSQKLMTEYALMIYYRG